MEKLFFFALIVNIIRFADFYCFRRLNNEAPFFARNHHEWYGIVSIFCNTTSYSYDMCQYPGIALHLHNFTMPRISEGGFKFECNNRRGNNIQSIFLQNLNIETIVPGAFNYQSNIKVIYIDNNAISVITHGIFNSLTNLFLVDLSFNRIETVSDDAFVGTKLEYLNLNRNRLKLFLNDYILRTIDKLLYLHLDYNNITLLDSDMSNSSVANLTLSNNNIDFINVTLLPRNLTRVDFSFNKISEVERMENIKSREILLNRNSLLSFKTNDMTEILDISENHIHHLENDLLGKNLKVLKLSSNNISEISSSCFHNLTNLFDLDLSHNNLSQIPLGTFDSLNNLNSLNISYNRLTEFPVLQLHSLTKLRLLYVQNNQIINVNVAESVKHLPLLREVNLQNNNWSCKNLLDFIHVLKEKGVNFNNNKKVDSNHVYGILCKPDEYSNVFEERNSGLNQNNLFKYLEGLNEELHNLNSINSGIKDNQEIDELRSLNSGIKQVQETIRQGFWNLTDNLNSALEQEHENKLKTQYKTNQLLDVLIKKLNEDVTLSNQTWDFSKPSSDKLVATEIQKTSSSNEVFYAFHIIMLITVVAFLAIMCYLLKNRLPKPHERSELNLMQDFESNH